MPPYFFTIVRRPPRSTPFPYPTLFRSRRRHRAAQAEQAGLAVLRLEPGRIELVVHGGRAEVPQDRIGAAAREQRPAARSEEQTSELQSRENLVCRLLLEKKNK